MRTSAISLITGTDRRKQTLSVVLSCKSPFDMWLLPDSPPSQHIRVCVCARPHAQWLLSLASHGNKLWHHWVALAGRRVIQSNWFITQPKGFFGGRVVLFSCLFLSWGEAWSKTSICQVWKTAASLMNNLGTKVRGVTPLLRFPLNLSFSILWSPWVTCKEQRFEFLRPLANILHIVLNLLSVLLLFSLNL